MGVGAMTDFGPLIANPKSFLLGAAAQFGIFAAYFRCDLRWASMTKLQLQSPSSAVQTARPLFSFAVSWDRPSCYGTDRGSGIFLYVPGADHSAPDYEASDHRKRAENQNGTAPSGIQSWRSILFPIIVTIVVCLILPTTAPLVGMLMLGNLFRESGVVKSAGGYRIQRPDVHRCNFARYFRWCNDKCRGILKLGYYQDRCAGSDCICIRYCSRRSVW